MADAVVLTHVADVPAALTQVQAQGQAIHAEAMDQTAGLRGHILLTVPQVRHLLAAATAPSWPPGHTEQWDTWTRRHQACARWSINEPGSPATLISPWSGSQAARKQGAALRGWVVQVWGGHRWSWPKC